MPVVEYHGINELVRSLHALGDDVERDVKEKLRNAGRKVAIDATDRFARYSNNVDFRVRVSSGGLVKVEEAKRKTTGDRPDFGALQMTKGLLPAREAKLEEAVEDLEEEIGRTIQRHGF